MKKTILTLSGIMFCVLARAGTSDPVADYKSSKSLTSSDILYKWTADINGDGQNDVLLDLKADYQEDKIDRQVPSWRVYIAATGGGSYEQATGVDDGGGDGVSPLLPQIDPEKVFVGAISQLGVSGIVTVQTDATVSGVRLSRIYAYTVDGSHLKRTLLAEYNAENGNAVYDQYLSDSHRTSVTLQQITP